MKITREFREAEEGIEGIRREATHMHIIDDDMMQAETKGRGQRRLR